MHTTEKTINKVLWRVAHNADLTGPVQIFNATTQETFEVPGRLLIHLVADWVRREKISVLENTEDWQALGLPER